MVGDLELVSSQITSDEPEGTIVDQDPEPGAELERSRRASLGRFPCLLLMGEDVGDEALDLRLTFCGPEIQIHVKRNLALPQAGLR